ncbi:MAG: hypothetical protein AAGF56_04595 [Pseudomonadota bacterium]
MRRNSFATVIVCLSPLATPAQEVGEPLSAIEWLSRSVEVPPAFEPPTAADAATPDVTTTPLDRPSKDPVGLLPSSVTGLPASLWSASSEAVLTDLIAAERVDTLPALQDLLRILMLAEADAPADGSADSGLFLARIDKLLDMGALDQAQSLIELADPDTAQLFRRWFDVALLTGTEDTVCSSMGQTPVIAPTVSARIFCLARNGDWRTAVLSLNTHRVLGDLSAQEEALLSRFLDPELFEGEPPLTPPDRITPLTFRMHEAIGEPLITATLPLAFAHADLRSTAAWKSQLEAAERLARYGAVSENVLLQLYTARRPAASGGIWDRAAAMQAFDAAITQADASAVTETLPAAWAAIEQVRAETLFAKLYAANLQDVPLTGDAAALAFRIGLLSPNYEAVGLNAPEGSDSFLIAIARGQPQNLPADNLRTQAIQAAFDSTPPPDEFQVLLNEGKLGEALLRAITLFDSGSEGDPRSVTAAIRVLRAVGLEDTARRAALQYILLDRNR